MRNRSFVYNWNAFAGGAVKVSGNRVQGLKDMLTCEEAGGNRFGDPDEAYPRDRDMRYENRDIQERFHKVGRWNERTGSVAERDGRLHPGDIPVQRFLAYQTAFQPTND